MKICPTCNSTHNKPGIYCDRKCYGLAPRSAETRAKMSAASKGKPKPPGHSAAVSKATKGKPKTWNRGENNPNYGGKFTHDPEIYNAICSAAKKRGQPWSQEHRLAHSNRMQGESNAMRGKKHKKETKQRISDIKKQQYKDGSIKIKKYKISKAEKDIFQLLIEHGYEVIIQFHIAGIPYLYDFYLPKYNLIIEYHGNYWHANPEMYPAGTKLKIAGLGEVLVDYIWERDKLKRNCAETNGFKFIHIWEKVYVERGWEAIEDAIQAVIS